MAEKKKETKAVAEKAEKAVEVEEKEAPKRPTLKAGDVIGIQTALHNWGFLAESQITGKGDDVNFRSVLSAFQEAYGLRVTGEADKETLKALS